jgi:drug/metabolite transporter (DMT)-like permease
MTKPTAPLSMPAIVAATCLALLAFAANSILCRLALGPQHMDAVSFTAVRIVSGAMVLAIIALLRNPKHVRGPRLQGTFLSALALFGYAIAFSLAYITLKTGAGALILFGCVQLTMIGYGITRGERPRVLEWIGIAAALAGLAYLVIKPDEAAPHPIGAALMAIAGMSWGIYSLRGRGVQDPIAATAGNFIFAAPLALALVPIGFAGDGLPWWPRLHFTATGVNLALASGAITSGLGYVIWYHALPGLTATRAATVQLCVPVLAAFGGLMLSAEAITAPLIVSSVLVLGGVGMAVFSRTRK